MFFFFLFNIFFFFFNDTATTEIYTLSLHDALPISYAPNETAALLEVFGVAWVVGVSCPPDFEMALNCRAGQPIDRQRSEEHTSELQSQSNLVCRLLLEKKKKREKWNMQYEYDVIDT